VILSLVAALGLAVEAPGQVVKAFDGSFPPITTSSFAQALDAAEITVPPENIWRCHGGYLETILDNHDESHVAATSLGMDGMRFEAPASARRGVALVHRAVEVQERAIDELVRCVGESAPEEDRARLPLVAAELKAVMLWRAAIEYALTDAYGLRLSVLEIGTATDIPLTAEQRSTINAIFLASAAKREHAARAMLESGLANRLRRAELAQTHGMAGLTRDEAARVVDRWMDEWHAANARGERPPLPPRSAVHDITRLHACAPGAVHDALVALDEVYGAMAAALPQDLAKRVRRGYLEVELGFREWRHAAGWGAARPITPDARWTARAILARAEIPRSRRTAARAILEEWADAQDAWKEAKAREFLAELAAMEDVPERRNHPFVGRDTPIDELVAIAAPFRQRLEIALGERWIVDETIDLPPAPGPDGAAALDHGDLMLTGSATSLRHPRRLPYESVFRALTGWCSVEPSDVDEWCLLAGADDSLRMDLSEVADAHRTQWAEKIAPIVTRSYERPPEGRRPNLSAEESVSVVSEFRAWAERVRRAADELDTAGRAWEQSLFDALRDALRASARGDHGGEDGVWVVDAVRFRRLADRVTNVFVQYLNTSLDFDDELLGGRRIDPIRAVLESGIARDAKVAAVRAALPALGPLEGVLREEEAVHAQLLADIGMNLGPNGAREEFDARVMPLFRKLMALRAAWRPLETEALERAKSAVSAADRTRIDRAANRLRFPSILEFAQMLRRVADDARRAAELEPDVPQQLEMIARIDAAESTAIEQIERRSAALVAEASRPAPVIDTIERLTDEVDLRKHRVRTANLAPKFEANRFAWYLVHALPPDVVWRCEPLVRTANLLDVRIPREPRIE